MRKNMITEKKQAMLGFRSMQFLTIVVLLSFSTLRLLAQGTIQIGSGTATQNAASTTILVTDREYSYSQQIVKASEYTLGGGIAGDITKIRYQFTNIGTTSNYGDWEVYIGHTSKTNFASASDWEPIANLTQVFNGNIHTLATPPANGVWFEIPFSVPFNYDGTSNLIIAVLEKTAGWTGGPTMLVYTSTINSGIVIRRDTNPYTDLANIGDANGRRAQLPQIQLEGQVASCLPPLNLAFTQTSFTGGDLSWTTNGSNAVSYNVQWGMAGFALGSGTTINGITTTSTSVTTIQNIDYEFYVQQNCGTDGESVWAGPFAFKTELCIPNSGTSDYLSSFKTTTATQNVDYTETARPANGYANFISSVVIKQLEGQNIDFTNSYNGGSRTIRIWVDFDHSGTFDASEIVSEAYYGNGSDLPGVITLAGNAAAVAGTYTMRIRAVYSLSMLDFDACETVTYGSTVDFTLELEPLPPCAGTPSAGTVIFSPANIAPNDTYSVTATGYTAEAGLTFTWEKSTDGGTTWTQVSTGSTYQDITGETAPALGSTVDYRLTVTCGVFPPDQATGSITSSYCVPGFTGTSDRINKVSTTGGVNNLNISNETNAQSANGYGDFSAQSVTVVQGTSFTVEVLSESSSGSGFAIWIDWNDNGVFETSERIANTPTYQKNFTSSITVPATADPKSYRMRIMCNYSSGNPADPCYNGTNSGEVEDYTVIVQAMVACSGTPSAGTVSFSPANVAPGTTYDVKATGYTVESGLTYTWETSTDGGTTWTQVYTGAFYQDITGETAPAFGLTVDYRLTVTCGAFPPAVATGALTSGYCVPNHGTGNEYLSSFITTSASQNVNYTANARPANGYADTTDMVIKQVEGQDISFTNSYSSGNRTIRIWVDFNNDGTFDASEVVSEAYYTGDNASGVITLAGNAAAVPGTYTMRTRTRWSFNNTVNTFDACEAVTYGSAVDFTLEIEPLVSCSGTPSAGTVTFSPANVAPNDPYDVKALGYTVETGLSYTWEKSTDGGTTWTQVYTGASYQDITGETAPAFGLTVDYRLTVTCGVFPPAVATGALTSGYCVPNHGTGDYLSSFITTTATQNVSYTTSVRPANGYADTTDMVIKQFEGQNIDFTNSYDGGARTIRIWVDFNNDGTFDASEMVSEAHYSGDDQPGVITLAGNAAAVSGSYTMRVRAKYDFFSISNFDACEAVLYGSAVDFTLELEPLPPCAGTPSAGTVSFSPADVAPGDSYDVKATGYTLATGLTYTWEKSTDGGTTWTQVYTGSTYQDITGETASAFGSTVDYRLTVTCGAFPPADATGSITTGYCIPSYSDPDDYTSAFSTTVDGSVQTNYTATAQTGTNGYNNLSGNTSYNTTVEENGTVSFSHTYAGLNNNTIRIWVDWNNNGTFEDSEEVHAASYATVFTQTGSFNIPSGTLPGNYRMRVRSRWGNNVSAITACGAYSYGQALDFTLVVTPASTPPPCTNDAGTISGGADMCVGASLSLTSDGDSGGVWSTSNAAFATVDAVTGVVSAEAPGSVTITYTVSASGCADATATTTFEVNDPGNAGTISGGADLCVGASLTLTSDGDSGGVWSSSDASFATVDASTGVVTAVGAGSVTITYTVSVSGCADATASASFEVNDPGNAGIISGGADLCVGDSLVLTSNGDANGVWSTSNAAFATVEASTGKVKAVGAGNVTITYAVTVTGCSPATATTSFAVNAPGNAGTISGGADLCVGKTLTLTSDGDANGVWSTSNASFATVDASSGEVTGVGAGSVTITYTVSASGCPNATATTAFDVTAPNYTASDLSISSDNTNASLAIGNVVNYTALPAGGTWSVDNANATIDPTTGVFTAQTAGTVVVTYSFTNSCGDVLTASDTRTIAASGSTGINDIESASNVSLFPNPATEQVSIVFTLTQTSSVQIDLIDMNGKVLTTIPVSNAHVGENTLDINVSDYANGIYSLVIRSNDVFTTKKLVIAD